MRRLRSVGSTSPSTGACGRWRCTRTHRPYITTLQCLWFIWATTQPLIGGWRPGSVAGPSLAGCKAPCFDFELKQGRPAAALARSGASGAHRADQCGAAHRARPDSVVGGGARWRFAGTCPVPRGAGLPSFHGPVHFPHVAAATRLRDGDLKGGRACCRARRSGQQCRPSSMAARTRPLPSKRLRSWGDRQEGGVLGLAGASPSGGIP